jgi:hypothetical protein
VLSGGLTLDDMVDRILIRLLPLQCIGARASSLAALLNISTLKYSLIAHNWLVVARIDVWLVLLLLIKCKVLFSLVCWSVVAIHNDSAGL